MKKTLTALAVMALSSAAMAQVTITGSLIMGYKATKSAAAGQAEASGLGVDTSEIDFASKEDLGGGQTIVAKMALAGADRSGESGNGSVKGRDASLTYTNTSFGQVKLDVSEATSYFAAVGQVGAPIIEMDGKLQESKSSNESISYSFPVGPVFLSLSHAEGTAGLGLGKGAAGSADAALAANYQRNNQIAVYYAGGKTALLGVYRAYDNRVSGGTNAYINQLGLPLPNDMIPFKKDLLNLQGSYDLGAVKLGLGYQYVTTVAGANQTDVQLTAAVPVGNWTFGAMAATSRTADAKSSFVLWDTSVYNGTATGYSLGASYALSKRTSITTRYASWTHSGYTQYAADLAAIGSFTGGRPPGGLSFDRTANETSILLSHAF